MILKKVWEKGKLFLGGTHQIIPDFETARILNAQPKPPTNPLAKKGKPY
jgi:hypothetical protein